MLDLPFRRSIFGAVTGLARGSIFGTVTRLARGSIVGAVSCLAGALPVMAQPRASAVDLPVGAARNLAAGPPPVLNGGFGSGLSIDPRTGDWLLLTDRGPNYDTAENVKAFLVPDFTPMVGRFRLVGKGADRRLQLMGRVRLRRRDAVPLVGLPNPAGAGATGERAVTADGRDLAPTPDGIDPEGIHAVADGTFWVAEEYGPSLVHFGTDGREIERVNPFGGARSLPAVLARRRPNRGFEGLTGDLAGTRLVAILQSPLDNPKAAGRASRWTRIVVYQPATGTTEQFVYPLDRPEHFVGDCTLLPDGRLLVIENDGTPPSPASVKRIYRVDFTKATAIGSEESGPIEALDSAGLARRGIVPVSKELVVDLTALGYRHDKPEGLAAVNPHEIAIINDDDFGVTDGGGGKPAAKRLQGPTGPTDRNRLWIITVDAPLWDSPPRR